jgi:pimeloyl-ACP methyl ester carboxylesterase
MRAKAQETFIRVYFSDPNFWFPEDAKGGAPEYNSAVNQLTWAALQNFDLTPEVSQITQPVLILFGEDDPAGLELAEETRAALKSAQVEYNLLQKCGHFWHECPDQIYPRVRVFLKELD